MRRFLLALPALALSGCLVDEARIEAVAPEGSAATAGRSAVVAKVADGAPGETRRGPLPYDLPVTWSLRGADGRLLFGHARVQSPLPWWQRFPCDLAVDLWPGEVVVAASATVAPVPVRVRPAADITAEARAHGYAP